MVRQIFSRSLQLRLLRHIIILSLGLILAFSGHHLSSATSNLKYRVYPQSNSEIHIVTIPLNGNYSVVPEVTAELTYLADFALKNQAIAAINGGYFDPINQKTTSYITQDNDLVADPRTNERLIDNPDLKPYLGKILNRSEFRRYDCKGTITYDITLHSEAIPANCTLLDALGAGPQLLPSDTSEIEGFTAYEDDKLIRNAIGGDTSNARSAIAINEGKEIIFAMVGQTTPTDSGMSLTDLATFLQQLGATKAMNLDGGSSSSLYYQGKTYYGRLDREGDLVQRPLKSVLLVR